MDCTDNPVDCNCFEIGYCGHHKFSYKNIQFNQSTNLILSHFQEEDHPFINDTLKKRHNWFHYIFLQTKGKSIQNGYIE